MLIGDQPELFAYNVLAELPALISTDSVAAFRAVRA